MSRTATIAQPVQLGASPLQAWLAATANLLAAAFAPAPQQTYLAQVPAAARGRLNARSLRLLRSAD